MKCPACETENADTSKFCSQCGQELEKLAEPTQPSIEEERKHVTILFSDLSGYTTMSETLDPEEVKEIMRKIFSEASQILAKYEGLVEKYIGDAVMAIFGVPVAHEDDPVRAIKAAREIHELVEKAGQEVKDRIGKQLLMHSGISTGLVVTGDMGEGTGSAIGDTVNVASRLTDLAKPGEILVGEHTYKLAEHSFTFEQKEPTKVKGKEEPVELFKVLTEKRRVSTIHRLTGLRSILIGREDEMAKLKGAVKQLGKGKGSIISVMGEAGTGKSRLAAEFQADLNLKNIKWIEGRSHAFAQNIPYYMFIDLIRRMWQIEEKDSPEEAKEKIETNVKSLQGIKDDNIPYIGNLLGLRYKETDYADPESWKSFLFNSVKTLFGSLTHKSPTIICLEDLHWADSSSVELLHSILFDTDSPALFLCVYRPEFTLFSSRVPETARIPYEEIYLKDLSQNQAQDMLKSLLKSDTIPEDLSNFVRDKAEGNPFYLEEVINSLIEIETLVRDNGDWRLTSQLEETGVPLTLTGVITARIDRLEKEMKRVLQEASVVGRIFLYEILKRITEIKDHLEGYLDDLELADLIRKRSIEPELEYIFKHALTQDVVYNGLLKKERKEIHEHVGQVIEVLFKDRLPEFYETLAFHFKQGKSLYKAVDYLMKSGEKNIKRYAVEESYNYYKEAFDLLVKNPDETKKKQEMLIDLIIQWALVFYYRGNFERLSNLLKDYEGMAVSLDDKTRLGMFYAWHGWALVCSGKVKEGYDYLCKALELGEEIGDQYVIGYACNYLAFACFDLGLLEKAFGFGARAQEIAPLYASDQYLYYVSLNATAFAYGAIGNSKKALEAGKAVVDYGQKHSNMRSQALGYWGMGFGHMVGGDFHEAIECWQKALQLSTDPFYSLVIKWALSFGYIITEQFKEAEELLKEIRAFLHNTGPSRVEIPSRALLALISFAKGHMKSGLMEFKEAQRDFLMRQYTFLYVMCEHVLGKLYLHMVDGPMPSMSIILKNIWFLIRNVPLASKKAEHHFYKTIEVAKEIGAKGIVGQAYLDLGLLYKTKKKPDKAKECISEAIRLFEQGEAQTFVKQAKETLQSLN